MRESTRGRRLVRLTAGLGTLAWLLLYTLLVTYDLRAWVVVPSAWRYVRFPVDPAIAADLPAAPTDPAALDQFVHAHIPWASDAAVWGLPWYFPTPGEVVRAGRGDCEAQAVVLASLLAARGVPYSFRASFSHLWVDYPGRLQRQGERDGEAMMANVGGRYRFRWPELPQLREHFSAQVELLWTPLDPLRKILLLLGWPLICYARRRRRPMA